MLKAVFTQNTPVVIMRNIYKQNNQTVRKSVFYTITTSQKHLDNVRPNSNCLVKSTIFTQNTPAVITRNIIDYGRSNTMSEQESCINKPPKMNVQQHCLSPPSSGAEWATKDGYISFYEPGRGGALITVPYVNNSDWLARISLPDQQYTTQQPFSDAGWAVW